MKEIKVDCNIPGAPDNTTQKQLAFLLDYATYASPDRYNRMLASRLSAPEISPAKIFSHYEAIGAYLKEQNPQIDGDIQVVDIGDKDCHTFTINFTNGRYTLHRNGRQPQAIPLASLLESCLQIPAARLEDFNRFLDTVYPNGKPFGAIVWDALARHEHGEKYYDDLIAIFGHPEWAHITINALVAFKTTLLEKAAV
ncbi:MAG TPA: hypothetical protein VGE79_15965, partial [Niastella sp.]